MTSLGGESRLNRFRYRDRSCVDRYVYVRRTVILHIELPQNIENYFLCLRTAENFTFPWLAD